MLHVVCTKNGSPKITGAHRDRAMTAWTVFEVHDPTISYKEIFTHSVRVVTNFTPFSGIANSTGKGLCSLWHFNESCWTRSSLIRTAWAPWSISVFKGRGKISTSPLMEHCQNRCGTVNSASFECTLSTGTVRIRGCLWNCWSCSLPRSHSTHVCDRIIGSSDDSSNGMYGESGVVGYFSINR